MLSPSSRSPPSSSVFEKKTPPHLRRLAKPTSGGQEPEKGQPTCQMPARDQCVAKSLQHETLHERAREPSREPPFPAARASFASSRGTCTCPDVERFSQRPREAPPA